MCQVDINLARLVLERDKMQMAEIKEMFNIFSLQRNTNHYVAVTMAKINITNDSSYLQ